MKRTIALFALLATMLCHAFSCDIKICVQEAYKKAVYAVGDEIVIDVQVQLRHRHCPLAIKDTKFSYINLKIIEATEWKESSAGIYTREVKARITDGKAGDAKLVVDRTCEREGGHAVCWLKKG